MVEDIPDTVRIWSNPEMARLELDAVNQLVSVLQNLPRDSVAKVLRTVTAFLGVSIPQERSTSSRSTEQPSRTYESASSFSEDRSLSPKEFMLQKKPMTDVERVATLAYYLTHYRSTPTFKTIDLSQLNTEAAQIKFSNAAFSVNNARTLGFLISAPHGAKQLSAGGELFVQSLPDRAAAREAMKQFRNRRKGKKVRSATSRGSIREPDEDQEPEA